MHNLVLVCYQEILTQYRLLRDKKRLLVNHEMAVVAIAITLGALSFEVQVFTVINRF